MKTQVKKCEDEEMNFETGPSWVTIVLDMYLCSGVRPPGGWRKERPGNGGSLERGKTKKSEE